MVQQFTVPSANDILAAALQTYQAQALVNGYQVSPDPGSEVYVRFLTFAQLLAVAYNIMQQQMDARLPDTATGSDLDRVLNQFGLQRKPATSAEGFIQLIASAPQALAVGMQLSATNSLLYQVSQSGIYAPNANVPVTAIDVGSATDLGIGSIMTWSSPLALMQTTAPVSVALTGGSDQETDAQARVRLLQTLQNPPGSGNTQQLINLSSNIDPIVQAGFVYADYNGAGTQLIALTGYQTDGYYIGRDIPHLQTDNTSLNGGSSPYNFRSQNYGVNLSNDTSQIYGQLAAGIANPYATVITTVNNIAADFSLALTLPFPVGSPINGLGGGWQNFQGYTWPNPDGYAGLNYCSVIGVTSPVEITLIAPSASSGAAVPIPGLTLINWINKSGAAGNGWQIVQATVLSATDHLNNTWTITLDTPLVCGGTDFYGHTMVTQSDFIFPASVNAQNYLDTIMATFATLGPGQVVSDLGLLALGANRSPSSTASFPYTVDGQFLQALTTNNEEIYSASFLFNDAGVSGPPVAAPPNIYIPGLFAWYDATAIV